MLKTWIFYDNEIGGFVDRDAHFFDWLSEGGNALAKNGYELQWRSPEALNEESVECWVPWTAEAKTKWRFGVLIRTDGMGDAQVILVDGPAAMLNARLMLSMEVNLTNIFLRMRRRDERGE